ncbi:MAG: YqaE/Pmp3 family membrane protein [Opitutaceae bacterium]
MDNKIVQIILAVLLPPIAVFLKKGAGTPLILSIVLWILGVIPGIAYALYVVLL